MVAVAGLGGPGPPRKRLADGRVVCLADDYIRADRSTDIGCLIQSFDWGDASSDPASVHDGLCTA